MKKILNICCLLGLLLHLSSCKDWLSVEPEDRFLDKKIFSTPQGFEDAMNGVYLQLAGNDLYGDKLTLSTIDIMAHRYYINSSTNTRGYLSVWDYDNSSVKGQFSSIWGTAYSTIGNINHLLYGLDTYGSNLTAERRETMKGEALALRAMLHFDLLRIFGPVYTEQTKQLNAIPYNTKLVPDVVAFSTAEETANKVIEDLNQAINLLSSDGSVENGYASNRNFKLNHVAALGLKARVLQWIGAKEEAFQTVTEAIEKAEKFTWISQSNVTDPQNPDRVFYPELLFTVYNSNLYLNYERLFYFELDDAAILAAGGSVYLNTIFENSINDYRNTYTWKVPPLGQATPVFFKYADIQTKNDTYKQRFAIPLIRKSELYYIAAETAPVAEDGLVYLNTVRTHRGIPPLDEATNLSNEILKEYRKEFFGEGQLWYYYKRNHINQIVTPQSTVLLSVPENAWVVPVPETEFQYR